MTGAWHWVCLSSAGNPVPAPPGADARFPTQGDAENYIGQAWPDLLAAGVDAVSLQQDDRLVYGPMSLHPPSS